MSSSLDAPAGVTRPIVFFDITIGDTPAGRIKMATSRPSSSALESTGSAGIQEGDLPPLPASRKLADLSIPQFMCQGGDFIRHDGTGTFSIYGPQFDDENFEVKHNSPGLLSMANSGPNTNGCQFFITTAPANFLDGKHTVFGRVIDGLLTVRKIENTPTGANNR
ncbi:hypothetical protein A1Q2_02774 [Trichosporon asahii var. asahii CBS 8904]|uniref:Peptidyl-prolyl cis-trans isomerase n=2 Tax=Trichosporon asahii var. asahii TaxID=189963 RepID=K1W1X6_TRIAC|nr:hypothetical protein A1Q1_07187 [Trichosporon asahii var. asahii CBS 2479]EJT51599.1 hypothetical protein A1Q1_07187 [Trichosporon asahii var. asahii CBS 2479]EKD02943.1 hypothetical protein A1Q2_02774 [Trichosporon asahii var. asahii CBS 8904]